jgi:hypothetical protein
VNVPLVTAGMFAGTAVVAAGSTLATQAIVAGPIPHVQHGPDASNHAGAVILAFAGGIGGLALGARAGSGGIAATLGGAGVAGAAAGAYLLAPAIRRWTAEH